MILARLVIIHMYLRNIAHNPNKRKKDNRIGEQILKENLYLKYSSLKIGKKI